MKPTQVVGLAFVFVLLALLTATANPVPAPAGLVGWWKGDGTALDSVATNNGVNQNVAYTNGVVGQAFAFDPENYSYGTYCAVQIADQPAYALTNSLTIEGWVRPRGDGYLIFFRGDHRPGLDPYFLGMQGNNLCTFVITDQNGNSASVQTPLIYNQWTHLAATLDGSTGIVSIYTNSVLAGQTNTTIRSFFEANLDLVSELPRFNFFDMSAPIFSRPRYLPGSKINGAQIDHAVISDGCIINRAKICTSIVGLRTIVGSGTELHRVIVIGSDFYESLESVKRNESEGLPRIGIGENTRIENAIIDKNARIGNNVIISPAGKPDSVDHANYFIRDGIVIIPKDAVIPDGTVI